MADLPRWALPAAMGLLALALFGDALVVPGRVPSVQASDLRTEYLYWRQFAFDQIRHGHFPLWNPYAFCGTPFFADPQSALLYPPNWLNLFLSPARAASWLTVIHFFLAGWFAGLLCRRHGRGVMAAILGGALYACSGPIMTNLRPGHLPLLFSAAWTPLLLLCVDGITGAGRRRSWVLLGIAVVAMLALDGYPQFAYYSALAAGIYALARLPWTIGRRRAAAALAVTFIGGWAIAAAQIMACAQFAAESIRAGGMSLAAAGRYSLPPENLLTLIVPGFLGDAAHLLYYGRWYWWEVCLFIGPAALLLAAYAAIGRGRNGIIVFMTVTMFVLALGAYTPLFGVLYDWLPGFGDFRATARFGLLGILFLAVGAAIGWDRLTSLRMDRRRNVLATIALTGGAGLALAAVWAANAQNARPGDFDRIIQGLAATGQTMETAPLADPAFASQAASFAAGQFAVAAGVTILTALLLFARRWRGASAALALLAIGQIIWFAGGQRSFSDSSTAMPANWAAAIAALPPGRRVLLNRGLLAESGVANGFLNVGGSNPLVLARTARFLAAVQADAAASVGLNYPIRLISPRYRMLRCGVIIPGRLGGPTYPIADPLPRLLLVGRYSQAADPDAALAAVLDGDFDPATTVILESPAAPTPRSDANPGSVRLVGETTDELEIEADLSVPQVLLVTDAYSAGWRAVPLAGTVQDQYQVLPADYCLRAIPLSSGHHHFRLEYRPTAFIVGRWISLGAVAVYAAILVCFGGKQTLHSLIHLGGVW